MISGVISCLNSRFLNSDVIWRHYWRHFLSFFLKKIIYSHQRKKDMFILDFKNSNTNPATELVPYCFWSQLHRSWYISGALRRSSHPFFKNLTFEVKDYHFFFSGGAKVEKYSNILPTNDHNISFCFSIRTYNYWAQFLLKNIWNKIYY